MQLFMGCFKEHIFTAVGIAVQELELLMLVDSDFICASQKNLASFVGKYNFNL